LDLANIEAKDGLEIHQIRLILDDQDNYIEMQDGSVCELDTPSQQNTGLKIIVPSGMKMRSDRQYRVSLKLDLKHSLVFKGNGGCLLKPVLEIGSIEEQIIDVPTSTTVVEPTTTTPETTTTVQDVSSICSSLTNTVIDPIAGSTDFLVCF